MKKLKNLALVLSGVVLGIAITLTPEIHAATSKLLGGKVVKVVDVKLNGKKIGEGGIISNTTYLPVRAVVDSLNGVEVGSVTSNEVNIITLDTGMNEEEIKKQDALNLLKNKIEIKTNEVTSKQNEIDNINKLISEYQTKVDAAKQKGVTTTDEIPLKIYKETELPRSQEELEKLQKELSDLESQLAELQK